MTDTIVVTDWDWPDLSVEESVLDGTGVELVSAQAKTPEDVIEAARGADGLIVQYASIPADVFEALDLRVVGRTGIGVDSVDVKAATAHGVQVLNVPDYCLEEVPTHALSLLLTVARNTAAYDQDVKAGTWDWTNGKPIDRVIGSTLGLVGFGKLPRRLTEVAAGFDFDVIAYDPYVDAAEMNEYDVEKVTLEELLARARFVSVHAPLTDETRNTFDAGAFEQMREDAVLLNTARGGLVNVEALRDALEAGAIAGAGIDVLPEEPPDPTPPFDHPNVVFTPHVAFYSEQSLVELRTAITEDVFSVLRGEDPRNPVNDPH